MTKQQQFDQACCDGDLEIVKSLINDPDVDPSYGDNYPIRRAAIYGHKDIVKLLMQDSHVDPSDVFNYPIRLAAICGHKEVVELLLTDKRVMDKIDPTLTGCKESGGYELLKACVDERKRVLEREKRKEEKKRRVQEAIEEMSADCELYF